MCQVGLYYTIHHVIANPSVCLVSIYHSYSRAVEGKEKVGVKHTPMASAGLRAYNGGLPGPSGGPGGRTPRGGQGASPPGSRRGFCV